MKKLLTLLMLLCTVCTGAWAEIQSSTLLNPVPYLIRNLNCGYIANDLSRYHANSTDTSDGYGQFIFIETGTANQYKIYELSTKRYFSAKANFNTSAKAQTELVENEQSATTWIITQKNSAPDKYTISPSTNTGAFLNFHGGTSDNGNINGAVGFHTNGSNDEGSFWLFEKCQYLPESPIEGKVYTIINDHKGVPYYVANTQTTNSIQDITAERSTNGSQEWICWNASSGGLEFVNVLDGQKLKSANNYVAFDIDDLRKLVGFSVLGHNTMEHIAGDKNNNTLNGGIFTKKTGVDAVFNEHNDIWSTDFIFSPTGQQAYKLIVSGKDDATVTYSDQTRRNDGYFVFADEYTPQEGDFDFHAPTGYRAIFSVDTENNTITVTYTEDGIDPNTLIEVTAFDEGRMIRLKGNNNKYIGCDAYSDQEKSLKLHSSADDWAILYVKRQAHHPEGNTMTTDYYYQTISGYKNGLCLDGIYQGSIDKQQSSAQFILYKSQTGDEYYLKHLDENKWISCENGEYITSTSQLTSECALTMEDVETIPVTMYNIKGREYASFFAPFDVTLPDGYTAYSIRMDNYYEDAGSSRNDVPLIRIDENGKIAAGYGAIIYKGNVEYDDTKLYTTKEVRLTIGQYGVGDSGDWGSYLMLGSTYTNKASNATLLHGDYLYTFNFDSNGVVGFYYSTYVNGFKAYIDPFVLGEGDYTRSFTLNFDGLEQPTFIDSITTKDGSSKIYGIDGCLRTASKSGVNIVNGKKVILK